MNHVPCRQRLLYCFRGQNTGKTRAKQGLSQLSMADAEWSLRSVVCDQNVQALATSAHRTASQSAPKSQSILQYLVLPLLSRFISLIGLSGRFSPLSFRFSVLGRFFWVGGGPLIVLERVSVLYCALGAGLSLAGGVGCPPSTHAHAQPRAS